MHAFLRRFLMHYGIYRRYPLGLLPALRNEPRRNYRRGAPTRTERGKISEALESNDPARENVLCGLRRRRYRWCGSFT